jgi:hypothetical protein
MKLTYEDPPAQRLLYFLNKIAKVIFYFLDDPQQLPISGFSQ